ncbi:hypothetical protein ACLMJK_007880 [Lecanora helva]
MSLAEIPQSDIRRNRQVVKPENTVHKSRPRAPLHHGDENSDVPRESPTIRSMLKNTTELGDVGQLVSHPSRMPVPNPRVSSRMPSKTQVISGKHHRLPPHYPMYNGYNGRHAQGNVPSNRSGSSIHSYRAPRQRPSFEDNRAYSMTQSSYNSHSLTNRHPQSSGYNYSRGGVNGVRPRSPYAYPTRLKRPGHRPSSPTSNDVNRSVMSSAQGSFGEPTSRTTTPLSAYNPDRTPSPFHHVINRSDPDLKYYPPYLASGHRKHHSPSSLSIRPSTPKPSPSVSSISSSSRIPRRKSFRSSNQTRPSSPLVQPLFYDYTEEFEDHQNHRGSAIPTDIPSRYSIEIDQNTYSEPDGSPESTSIADASLEISPQESISPAHGLDPNGDAQEASSLRKDYLQAASQDLSDVLELPETDTTATEIEVPPEIDQHHPSENELVDYQNELAPLRSLSTDEQLHTPESDQKPKTDTAGEKMSQAFNHGSTSPAKSMLSIGSSAHADLPYPAPKPLRGPPLTPVSHLKTKVFRTDAEQTGSPGQTIRSHRSESLRGPSFEGHSRVSTEILSPTPERSITSPTTRSRFSKILSIDENTEDQQPLEPPSKILERVDTPMQRIHSAELWKNSDALEAFRRKRSMYTLNSPLKHSTPTNAPIENSDSEDEPELTAGFRQTFCKDSESFPVRLERSLSMTQSSQPSVVEEPTEPVNLQVLPNARDSTLSTSISHSSVLEMYQDKGLVEAISSAPIYSSNDEPPSNADEMLAKQPKTQPSFRSYSPPVKPRASDLPFDFTPLIRRASDDVTAAEIDVVPEHSPEHVTPGPSGDTLLAVKSGSETGSIHRNSLVNTPKSTNSRPTSRPWNYDSSYPWNDKLPTLEVSMPLEAVEPANNPKQSRTQSNVERVLSSTAGLNKLRKFSLQDSRNPTALSANLSLRKRDPGLSVLPGQFNSSHDIMQSYRQRTRFVDTFDTPSPAKSAFPLSPNEVRSFFSDDSSQIRPKGIFRRRVTDLKARAAARRANSMDEARGHDRGLLSSALGRSRASGRSSRQSRNTTGASMRTSVAARMRWKMIDRIRLWYHRGEDKIRDWGWKMRYRSGKHRAASAPTYTNA